MKNLGILLLFALLGFQARAQKSFFAYVESEGGQAFYIKHQDQLISSSPGGYVILASLRDTTYTLTIGFPSSDADIRFRLNMNGRDRGFLLRKFDFGWGLFDMQSLSILKPLTDINHSGVSYRYRTNDFTALLAKASNDTSLFYVPIDMPDVAVNKPQEVPVEETVEMQPEQDTLTRVAVTDVVKKLDQAAIFSRDSLASQLVILDSLLKGIDSLAWVEVKEGDFQEEVKESTDSIVTDVIVVEMEEEVESAQEEVIRETVLYKKSEVRRYSESSTSEGFGLTFFDQHELGIDTIRLIIPNPKYALVGPDSMHSDEGMLEVRKADPPVTDTFCPLVAGHNDFLELRKNMAAQVSDESMVDEAKKAFQLKCYTTEQVKNLSALFLTPAAKFMFFEAARQYISDQENFSSLGQELRDEQYSKRFKALTRE